MSEISDRLKQQFEGRLSGELASSTIEGIGKVCWKPLTGREQKLIQKFAEKSTAEGICMHVKSRALDESGEHIFKDIAIIGLMNDFDFEMISKIFFEITGADLSAEDIEKN